MAGRKKKQPLTLGDVAGKISRINFNNIVYVGFLISALAVGYLYNEVQHLKSGAPAAVAGTESTAQPSPAAAQPKVSLKTVKEAFNKSKIKFGDANKKLVVVEVADPSCPYCHIAGGEDPELNKQVGSQFTLVSDGGSYVAPVTEIKKLVDAGKASFSYIYYPGHGNGELGTKALYCAFDAGKFWEVHDLLMSNAGYDLLNNTVKNDVANSQTLADFLSPAFDSAEMKTCLESGKYDAQLKEDQVLAGQLQIQGTPGFYLNDTIYAGAYSFKDMEATVKKAGI